MSVPMRISLVPEKIGIQSVTRISGGVIIRLDRDIIAPQCESPKDGISSDVLGNWIFSLFAQHGGISYIDVRDCREIVVRIQHVPDDIERIIAKSSRFNFVGDAEDTAGSPEILDFVMA